MKVSSYLSLAVCFGAVTFSSAAFAGSGPIGAGGRLILSGDRLFGVTASKMKTEDGTSNDVSTQSRTDVALLWHPIVSFSPSTIPQVGLDVGVVAGLTLGGSIGFFSEGGTNENTPNNGATVSRDSPSITAFQLAPRAGYGIPLAPRVAFWPRLGFSYYNIHSSSTSMGNNPTTTKTTVSGLQLNLDPTFVFLPVEHFGITAGPYLDLPLSGSTSSEATVAGATISAPDDTTKFTAFGLKLGLLGAFL
jgi:hypothetical protein